MGQFIFVSGCSETVVLRDLSCFDCAPYSIATDNNKIEIYGAIELDNFVNADLSVFNLTGCRTCRVLIGPADASGAALMFYGPPGSNGSPSLVDFGNIVNCYGRTCLFTEADRC
jgi:hypothetical protein